MDIKRKVGTPSKQVKRDWKKYCSEGLSLRAYAIQEMGKASLSDVRPRSQVFHDWFRNKRTGG